MNWYPRKTKSSCKINRLIFEKANDHPLKIREDNSKYSSKPIHRSTSESKWIDPLTAVLNDVETIGPFVTKNKRNYLEDDFEKWESVANLIINKSIPLIKSIQRRTLLTEYPTSSTSSTNLNFIQNLANAKSDLIEAWQSNSRVKALRTVCFMAKNLGDIERFDLYAYKFVLSIRIMDEFNELIFRRIEEKLTDDVEVAKETSINWSYKICSIQELIPRLYLEIATLNTFRTYFVYDTTDKLMNTIQRLIETVRGIGDPFMAVFVYAYLTKTVLDIFPDKKEIHFRIFSDFLIRIEQIKQIETSLPDFLLKFDLAKPNETCPYLNYTRLYTVPLDWLIRCLLYKSDYQQSVMVYKELNVKLNNYQSSNLFFILFNQMLPKLNSSFVIENYKPIIELIKTIFVQNINKNIPKYQLIVNLSILFLNNDTATSKMSRDDAEFMFKEIWRLIKTMNEKEYIICTNSWIDFAVKHFNMIQINSILNNIIKHVITRKEFVNFNDDLIQILIKILNSSTVDYKQFLASDIFVPFIEMFQKESSKVAACKTVIKHLIKSIRKDEDRLNYSDSDYITILIYINKTMHDSVDQLTSEEERKELSNLINEFINLVQFDTHADNLDFLVQCRSLFSFDSVIVQLVFNANKLSLSYCKEVENQLNSNSFLKACLAFACITIPSINNESQRAMLYLNTAHVSLRSGFIEQTEFFVRNAISTLDFVTYEKLSKTSEQFFVGYIKSILSFLVLVPDDLSKGYLYLFKKLLKTVDLIKFRQNDRKVSIYLCMLDFLSTISQPEFPYHMENIESNDIVRLNDEHEFQRTTVELGALIIERILEYLESLGLAKEYPRQSSLAFDCFYSLLNNGQWTRQNLKLLFNFWQLAIKNSLSDLKTIQKSIEFTRRQRVNFDNEFLDDLADKMECYYEKKKNEIN